MTKKALQMEDTSTDAQLDALEKLMERQNWLDEMRSQSQNAAGSNPEEGKPFLSVCHGQPWAGNVRFRYEMDANGQPGPTEALFTDFQSVVYGRPGQDVAHFLLTSTTREFRKNHVETILQSYLTELEDVITHQGKYSVVFDSFLLLHKMLSNIFLILYLLALLQLKISRNNSV